MGLSSVPGPTDIEYGSDAKNIMTSNPLLAIEYDSDPDYKPSSGSVSRRRTRELNAKSTRSHKEHRIEPTMEQRGRHKLNSKSANRTGKQKVDHLIT